MQENRELLYCRSKQDPGVELIYHRHRDLLFKNGFGYYYDINDEIQFLNIDESLFNIKGKKAQEYINEWILEIYRLNPNFMINPYDYEEDLWNFYVSLQKHTIKTNEDFYNNLFKYFIRCLKHVTTEEYWEKHAVKFHEISVPDFVKEAISIIDNKWNNVFPKFYYHEEWRQYQIENISLEFDREKTMFSFEELDRSVQWKAMTETKSVYDRLLDVLANMYVEFKKIPEEDFKTKSNKELNEQYIKSLTGTQRLVYTTARKYLDLNKTNIKSSDYFDNVARMTIYVAQCREAFMKNEINRFDINGYFVYPNKW